MTDAGLSVTPVAQENAEVPEDQVFQTIPPADSIVELDSAVEVYFNPVKEPQPIPDVTGENLEEAKRIVTEAGFVVGEITSETSDLPKDTVIRTNPVAQESAEGGPTGAIVLSAGPDTQTIPNVEGQAQERLSRCWKATRSSSSSASPPKPTTRSMSAMSSAPEPAVGGELASGSAITLIVSSGIEQVSVPPVAGLTEAQAKNLLTSKGLTPPSRGSMSPQAMPTTAGSSPRTPTRARWSTPVPPSPSKSVEPWPRPPPPRHHDHLPPTTTSTTTTTTTTTTVAP